MGGRLEGMEVGRDGGRKGGREGGREGERGSNNLMFKFHLVYIL